MSIEQWETITAKWANGQANTNQARYLEGDVVPFSADLGNLTAGTSYTIRVNLDYYQSNTDAGGFTGLDTYDKSIPGLPDNFGPPTGATADNTFALTNAMAGDATSFSIYTIGADVTSIAYSFSPNGLTRYADVTFTASGSVAELYWGQKLALPNEVTSSVDPQPATSSGASGFTGGSLQTKIEGSTPTGTWITPSNAVQFMPGVVVQGAISGHKFSDLNGNGVHDAGEPGLSGWAINLYKDNGDGVFGAGDTLVTTRVTADETTDANGDGTINSLDLGYYKFAPVLRGTYFITETQQAGWVETYPVSNSYKVTINETTYQYSNIDFLNFRSATINGIKLLDTNGNGVQDAGETTGIGGITINLYSDFDNDGYADGGAPIATTVTAADGTWSFNGLRPGKYFVGEVTGAGTGYFTNDQTSVTFTVASGENRAIDALTTFMNYQRASVDGIKYVDLNANGQHDAGEPGLAGVKVTLTGNGLTINGTTAADGTFSFSGLAPGDYSVTETPPAGQTPSTATTASFTLTSGEDEHLGYVFGNYQKASLSGVKYEDLNGNGQRDAGEAGLAGWTIHLFKNGVDTGLTATTGADGSYYFANLDPGTYTTTEDLKPGWTQSDGSDPETLTSGENDALGNDFGNYQKASLSGVKYEDLNGNGQRDAGEAGLAGWTIHLFKNGVDTGLTATTGADGSYSFTNLDPGTYTTAEDLKPGWTQSDGSDPETLTSGENDTLGNDFGNYQKACVDGIKYDDLNGDGHHDANEPGLANIVVTLTGTNSTGTSVQLTVVTAADGKFSFLGLDPGTYTVTETPPAGQTPSTDTAVSFTLTSGECKELGYVFGNYKSGTITGEKYVDNDANGSCSAGDTALPGWTVSLYADADGNLVPDGAAIQTVTTDGSGVYTFANVMPGKYVVVEDTNGWLSAAPTSYGVTVTSGLIYGDDASEKTDFFNYKLASLSGHKYNDLNGNSVLDPNEPGLAGWTINLYQDANKNGVLDAGDGFVASTTTDGSGFYEFKGLTPGYYVTAEQQQPGWIQTGYSSGEQLTSGECDKAGNDFLNFQPKPSLCLDKQVCGINGDPNDHVVDNVGDVINYKVVLANTGNMAISNVVVNDYFESNAPVTLDNASVGGDLDHDGILDVGETWTYSYDHTVTQDEIDAARSIVTTTTQIGVFTCVIEKCTGDLDLDNMAVVTATAGSTQVYALDRVVAPGVQLTAADFETVDVSCPSGCVESDTSEDTSAATQLWQLWNHQQAA